VVEERGGGEMGDGTSEMGNGERKRDGFMDLVIRGEEIDVPGAPTAPKKMASNGFSVVRKSEGRYEPVSL
jgi:hypothetical protein